MANAEHLKILRQGHRVWNKWRRDHPATTLDFSKAYLSGVNLSEADLSGVNLSDADLLRANLAAAILSAAILSAANLTATHLVRAILNGANLNGANLSRANLSGANLSATKLRDTNLTEADLRGANLFRTDLAGANLTEADLSGANLSHALLENTILNEAIFSNTTLADVDLSTAISLETAQHYSPSSIGVDTLLRSRGQIPEAFLRGVGLPDTFIEYLPSLLEQPIQFYSVFISYSHKDKVFAKRLYDALQGKGIRCWLDEHQLLPGDKIHVGIDRGIRMWDKVLLCCSKDSLKSWWVDNEIELAIQKEQRLHRERGQEVLSLIPLNLDGYMFKDEWESGWKGQITSRVAPNFTGWQRSHKKFEEQLERVVKALRSDASARGIAPPPKL